MYFALVGVKATQEHDGTVAATDQVKGLANAAVGAGRLHRHFT
jgi:hypothetical protein